MTIQKFTVPAVVTWMLLAAGCGVQPETLASLTEAVKTVQARTRAVDPVVSKPVSASPTTDFEPAHPERVDPFVFPSEVEEHKNVPTVTTSVAQVKVLGFAEVDELRVLLRSKNVTDSLKQGDTFEGVEVVAIKPPVVELRLGNLVWTASMFDGTDR